MSGTSSFTSRSGRSIQATLEMTQDERSSNPQSGAQSQMHRPALVLPPGLDLSALAGVSPDQVALIARLLQSGALPNPLSQIQPSVPPHSNGENLPTPVALVDQMQNKGADTDKEDGELEEGELGSDTQMQDATPAPPTPRDPPNGHGARAPQVQPAQYHTVRQAMQSTAVQPPSKRDAAKAFVAQLHMSGYGFDDISRHVRDAHVLARLYKELNIQPNVQISGDQSVKSPIQVGNATHTSVKEVPERPKRVAPAPAAPVPDRSEYLAKLAAARAKPKPPVQQPVPVAPSVQQGQEATKPRPTPNKVSYKTELVKQRLEALKAERAANKAAAGTKANGGPTTQTDNKGTIALPLPGPVPLMSHTVAPQVQGPAQSVASRPPPLDLQNVSAAHPGQPAPVRTAISPVPPTPGRPFGHLPGLFMTFSAAQHGTSSPVQPVAMSSANASPSVLSRKRPLADSDNPSSGEERAAKRFGQSRQQSPEQVVIQVSEDEDEEEISQTGPKDAAASAQDLPGNFYNPTTQKFQSGTATPNTTAEYLRTMGQLEDLKRQLAEKERDKAIAREARAAKDGTQQASKPNTAPTTPAPLPTQSAAAPRQEQRLQLQERLRELEQKLRQGSEAPAPSHMNSTHTSNFDGTSDVRESRQILHIPNEDEGEGQENLAVQQQHEDRNTAEAHGELAEADLNGMGVNQIAEGHDSSSIDQLQSLQHAPASVGVEGESDSAAMSVDSDSASDPASDSEDSDAASLVGAQHGAHTVVPGTSSEAEKEGLPPANAVEDDSQEGESDDDDSSDVMSIEEESEEESDHGNVATNDASDEMSIDDDASHGEHGESRSNAQHEASERTDDSDDTDHTEEEQDDEAQSARGSPGSQGDSATYEPDLALADDAAVSDLDEEQLAIDDGEIDDAEYEPELGAVVTAPSNNEKPTPKNIFTPYRSPLTQFKDYKYHPQYLDTVPGGYKSLTYNHQIDPNKSICPFEATGGRCNDRQCEHQHFAALPLSDNDLLKSLVTHGTPASDAEQSKRWKEGLAALIKQVRADGQPQDALSLAARIAEFRRGFVGDPTTTVLFS